MLQIFRRAALKILQKSDADMVRHNSKTQPRPGLLGRPVMAKTTSELYPIASLRTYHTVWGHFSLENRLPRQRTDGKSRLVPWPGVYVKWRLEPTSFNTSTDH